MDTENICGDGDEMREALLCAFMASVCFGLVLKIELPSWLSFILVIMGIAFSVVAIVMAVEYIDTAYANHLRNYEMAKVEPSILLLNTLKGCSPSELDYASRFTTWDITGMLGNDGQLDYVSWTLHLPGDDIPLELFRLFLLMSTQTEPYLFPISRHDEVVFKDYINVEKRLTIITNEIIRRGWADKSTGPYAARLKPHMTVNKIADILEVDL